MGCRSLTKEPKDVITLNELNAKARQFNSVVALPEFERDAQSLTQTVARALSEANGTLDRIGRLGPGEVNFGNTVRALDDLNFAVSLVAHRANLIKETSTNAALRDVATESVKSIQEWAVGLDYREDVYRAVKAFADRNPALTGEDEKLLKELLRDYRRAGLHLPLAGRQEVERLRKELTGLATDFDSNIPKAQRAVVFTRAELEGVPESFLAQPGIKTGDDQYTVMANITFHYLTVMEGARREETRKKLLFAHDTLAMAENTPLLQKILEQRDLIARKLGYTTWADFQIEPKMAKNAETARKFLEDLRAGLQPKFEAELREFTALKREETGNPNARLEIWDWRYYSNELKKKKYTVDAEKLREYFPYQNVLAGMFRIYEKIFDIHIRRAEPPYRWIEDLQLYAVSDAATGEPLGLFYLDMFPRPGKYNHFAQFDLIPGKLLDHGTYQRPTVALVCNFPNPAPGKPSLLNHQEVETLFHEFGHALHSIFTRAKYVRFSGTSVPRDFVEAPSQMLENWVWEKSVLDTFAAHYDRPEEKIPPAILARLKEARLATIGTFYRRQLAFALMDLALHTEIKHDARRDAVELSNRILGDVFLPVPPNTAFVAYFGHITGYDAGYYGYAWADAIAADMATVFEKAGYFDPVAGRRLREEIYAPGDSRDVNLSIQRFLGRPQEIGPFLKSLGIETTKDRFAR